MMNFVQRIRFLGTRRWLSYWWLFASFTAMGQGNTVTGTVTDPSGEPLPGVTILVKNSTAGTTTNIEGKYSIADVQASDIMVFSFVGMRTKEVTIGSGSVIDVSLDLDIETLNEVVVVGYGTQEAEDVTGAVSLIGEKDLALRPNSQIGSMLYGKAAGVVINPGSGRPGAGISINIRGISSINGSEPLYVVDGVPTSNTRALNPADIENITVLKDAASAAIYGAQGATGVVLITTKSGKSEKPTVNFNSYAGFSEITNRIDVLNADQYQELMGELGFNTNWTRFFSDTDWQEEIFQRGRTQNYQLSVAGKSDKTNYYISGSWIEEIGAIRSTEMSRTNFKLNLDQQVTDWLKLGTRVSYNNYSDVDIDDREVLRSALITPPNIAIFNDDGTLTSNPFQNWENPYSITDAIDRGFESKRFLGNAFAEIKFLNDFTFKSNIGVEQSTSVNRQFRDPFLTTFGIAIGGEAWSKAEQFEYRINDNTLNYKKTIDNHSLEVLVGHIFQSWRWEDQEQRGRGFSTDQIRNVGAAATIVDAGAGASEEANESIISRINYAYKDKYLLTVNFRRDGSSVFGPEFRYGNFIAGSVGWRISDESFLAGATWLDHAKVRVGWGLTGNDPIPAYSFLGVADPGSDHVIYEGIDESIDPVTNDPVDSVSIAPGTRLSRIENQGLKWEETRQLSIGLDFALFEGRVSGSVDVYDKQSRDVLLESIPIPASSGFSSARGNAASLQNRGLEVLLNTVNIDQDVKWETSLNVSMNRNKVLDLRGTQTFGGHVDGETTALTRQNSPFAIIYGYVFEGVDPDNGRAQYLNRDGELTYTPSPDDRRVIGNPHPDFVYGITNTVNYKGFGLSLFIQGSQGNDIINATRFAYIEDLSGPANQSTEVLRRWQAPGDITDIPGVFPVGSNETRFNHIFSSRFIEDGSYVRVKALTLSYDIPVNILSQVNIQGLKVYATGENLFTFTRYTGLDPEVNRYGGNSFTRGLDNAVFPQVRKLIFGLNLTL